MSFKIAARTILQLGAELVSSDAVAFYELIKNAFDAKSPKVDIDVDIALSWDDYVTCCEYVTLADATEEPFDAVDFDRLRSELMSDLDQRSQTAETVRDSLQNSENWTALRTAIEGSNRIVIRDTGEGMTLDDLNECFLTIGTRSRQRLRCERSSDDRPVLGEKGLGRLSSMRLGQRLEVRTSKAGEKHWHYLRIDWRAFHHDSDQLLEAVQISPFEGEVKEDPGEKGTTIAISALSDRWTSDKLKSIAIEQFSKLTDPFTRSSRYTIRLTYNQERVPIPTFDKILFDAAHASGKAHFTINGDQPKFTSEVHYRLRHRERTSTLEGEHLVSPAKCPSIGVLRRLGPFEVEFHWFNRRILEELDGIGDRKHVLELQSRWAGGLMVFRDGFRVHPYGDPDDDWLDLDSKALSSQGYKVNRRQIIGKVDISSIRNPALLDQTNREGLRDCPEKDALVSLLKYFLETGFREFLKTVDKEVQAIEPLDTKDIKRRVVAETKEMRHSLKVLKQKFPQAAEESGVIRSVETSMQHLKDLLAAAEKEVASYRKGRSEIVHLAGLGLMVELVTHELTRATEHALRTVQATRSEELADCITAQLSTLEQQLKTLQKRLSVIDPTSTSRRQVKEPFDLCKLVEDVLKGHEAQFARHAVLCRIVHASGSSHEWGVKMVKGMLIQVLENLIANSIYWQKQRRKISPSFEPQLQITLDQQNGRITVEDNGPGIPRDSADRIFEAFYTTKPPGEGKGLGLFISKEIAKYHGANLRLSEVSDLGGAKFDIFLQEQGGEA